MNKKILILTSACCLAFMLASNVAAESENGYIKKGNALYREKNWDNSLQAYLEGALKYKGSEKLNFNSGDAFYKKQDFGKAKDQFQKAVTSKNNSIKTKASYNTGNALFKEAAEKEKSDAQQAQELLKQAQNFYRQAINLDPKDNDAKYNYEIASQQLERVKQQCQMPKQQKPEDQKKQKQNNQQNENQPNKDEQPQAPEQNKEEQQKQSEAKKNEDKMSKDEAQMLIENYGQEGPRLELRDKHEPEKEKEVEKNW